MVTCCVGSIAIICGTIADAHDAYCLIIKLNYCHAQHQVLAARSAIPPDACSWKSNCCYHQAVAVFCMVHYLRQIISSLQTWAIRDSYIERCFSFSCYSSRSFYLYRKKLLVSVAGEPWLMPPELRLNRKVKQGHPLLLWFVRPTILKTWVLKKRLDSLWALAPFVMWSSTQPITLPHRLHMHPFTGI